MFQLLVTSFLQILACLGNLLPQETVLKKLDPAAWGASHAGQPFPEFVRGDECLFCHRNDIGPGWSRDAHGTTVRDREDAPDLLAVLQSQPALKSIASEVQYLLGGKHRLRFLKKTGFGKFAILNTQVMLGADRKASDWVGVQTLSWDGAKFANRCAGCHSTGVDSPTRTFSAFGLDCFTCHGDVPLTHSNDTSLVWLSKKKRKDSQAITSICASCHIRVGAKSRATGLPYPSTFIAGDNLFKEYEVDFTKAEDAGLNPGDRHVLKNIRAIVIEGSDGPNCIICHQVHGNSTRKHRIALKDTSCQDCHNAEGPMKNIKPYTVRSDLCEY